MNDRAKAYSKQRHRLAILNMLLSCGVLILFIVLNVPTYLKNLTLLISSNDYINLLSFFVFISVLYYIAMAPLEFYSGFVLEHKYALSNQTFKDWAKKEIKKAGVGLIIGAPFVISLYLLLRYSPLNWWFYTALIWFFISIVIATLAPALIVPIFYKYLPIKNKGLKDKLIKLSSKVGFRAEGVYEINMSKDTKKANAAVIGLGRQKRIVLCDTLIQNFNEDEIEIVMGHELGHHRLRHNLKTILVGGIATFLTFYITDIVFLKLHDIFGYTSIYDLESLVLIYAIITIINLFAGPLQNAFSRKLERDADMFTLKLTNNKRAFISTMKNLASQNLADTNPGKFYEIMLYNHPPISRRISFAESFK